jgi:hypothetical protein
MGMVKCHDSGVKTSHYCGANNGKQHDSEETIIDLVGLK